MKENFAKLRNIILTTQEEFIEYILVNKYTDYIEGEFSKIKDIMEVDVILGSPPENDQARTPKYHNKYI